MTMSLTCSRCKVDILGEDEDQLVERVQQHVASHAGRHGLSHQLSREHILARERRQRSRTGKPSPSSD